MSQDREHILPHLEGIRDEKRTAANTALRVGEALIMLLDYISQVDSGGKFLSRVDNDSAQGVITFLQGLLVGSDETHGIGSDGAATLLSLVFDSVLKGKDARSGFTDGKGIWMDALQGIIQTDGLEVRGWMRIMELIINRLQLMESDYSFTEGGEIEHVDYTMGSQLVLRVRKRHDNDILPFYEGDILYAKINDLLPQGSIPDGHSVTKHGSYFTVWMVVDSVDQAENTMTVSLYMSQEAGGTPIVPGGRNFTLYGSPIIGTDHPSVAINTEKQIMTENGRLGEVGFDCCFNATRHGNVAGSPDEQTRNMQKQRQQSWVLSTTDQRLAYYWHVDQPILRADNYALCLGILPTILDDAGVLPDTRDPRMPSLYINTIFYENAHHIYYPSFIVKVDRSEWTQTPTSTYTGVDGTYSHDGTLSDESLAAEVAAGRMTAADEARLKVIRTWAGTYVQNQIISEPYHFESFSRNMWLTHRLSPAHQSLTDLLVWQKMNKEWHVDKETSRVWRYGALWECLAEGTTQTPELGCSDWTLIQQPAIVLQITATKRLLRPRDFEPAGTVGTTLGFVLQFGGYDMTADILRSEAVWTRQSVGAELDPVLAAADAAWDLQHRYGDLTLGITKSDLPSNWTTAKEVQFTLTITKNGTPMGSRRITLH